MLRGNTPGKAFPQCVFDHWEQIKGLPLTDEKAKALVLGIRKRKGLKDQMPDLNDYLDKA
jgi:elongation factor 2